MKKESNSKVYIIVLNYNNWADTIECAESILANEYIDYTLVIVDNNSTDNSMQHIKAWADGMLEVWLPDTNILKELTQPLAPKPIEYAFYHNLDFQKEKILSNNQVVLIQSDKNKGYSAGNNIGIKYAITKNDFDYIWILNNDTVIAQDSLTNLVDCAKNHSNNLGLLGTTLLFYDEPKKIQAYGGKFNKYLAIQTHNLEHELFSYKKVSQFNKKNIDYIIGASMLISKSCIQKIGLMPEEYFIYFEEIDIATNCKNNNFDIDICGAAIVYHKESVSIKKENETMNDFANFYAMRNRLVFTKKYYSAYLPFVYGGLFLSLLLRLKRKHYKKAQSVYTIIKQPLSKILELKH